jgi:hypothetical protein
MIITPRFCWDKLTCVIISYNFKPNLCSLFLLMECVFLCLGFQVSYLLLVFELEHQKYYSDFNDSATIPEVHYKIYCSKYNCMGTNSLTLAIYYKIISYKAVHLKE